MVLMVVGTMNLQAQWHTKWHEVMGEATMVLANSKDIHDDINVSVKKKMVMDATLDAIQNAINLRLNPVVSTAAYKTILEKDYLTINDHLIDLLTIQNINWQRQASPIFVQDENNPKKWTVVIQGLVKKGDLEVPPPVITQVEPPKLKKTDPVVQPKPAMPIEAEEPTPEKIVVKKERVRKPYQKYLLGINAGATYDLPTSLNLDNGDFIDANYAIGYKLGVRLPLARNFQIGADYMTQELEFGEETGFGGFGNFGNSAGHRNGGGNGRQSHHGGGYDTFDATHYVSMSGFGFSMGSLRNVINPSIGVFYQRGDISGIGGNGAGKILKRGASFGLDIGRGRLKFGLEATAYWLNTSASFDGFGEVHQPMEILSDIRLEEANWSFGINMKLFL